VLGLDGAYVRSRHRRPEKNFEVIVGKVLGEGGAATRFAFPTNHLNGATMIRRALRRQRAGEQTRLTVFSDGEEGLRELQRKVVPDATHILDWFHVAMRFEHLLETRKNQGLSRIRLGR
jgi:transposase-like protein